MLHLKYTASAAIFEFPAQAEVMTIGRAETNLVVIRDPHVSALHGQIVRHAGQYRYQDLHSTNGSALERGGAKTVIDGTLPGGLQLLAGDRIILGNRAEPIVLEVIACALPLAAPTTATRVATRPLVSARETGARIESAGGSLVLLLALSDRLAQARSPAEAYPAFWETLREALPRVRAVEIVELLAARPVLTWRSAEDSRGRIDDLPPLGEELLVMKPADCAGVLACVPLRAGPLEPGRAPARLALVESRAAAYEPRTLDTLALAAFLLAARLSELDLVEALTAARDRLDAKNRYLREKAEARSTDFVVGKNRAMLALVEQLQKVAGSDATVLITGPSGSGKEVVAREIHRLSGRCGEIFATINCGALVESLLESELFGVKKGAFTGAYKDREGLFEVAHGGTLFLDEVGDMPPSLQVKLLRVLETREVLPVGGTRPRKVDVRVLAATHRDLSAEVAAGRFREDLFYRIHVFPVRLPALEERREDIPELALHLLGRIAASLGVAPKPISAEALRALVARRYPGNVRQLGNEIQRALLLSAGDPQIDLSHLSPAGADDLHERAVSQAGAGTLREQMSAVERVLIEDALGRCEGNRTHTARALGITRQALLIKLGKLGLRSDRQQEE